MKKTLFFILLLIPISSAVAVCHNGEPAITKPGYYGVLNIDNYDAIESSLDSGDDRKLAVLLSQNAATKIPSGIEVCIQHRDLSWYRMQITIPGKLGSYWLPEEALNMIK